MAAKRRSDEEMYKKLNAQLQGRLKKAEKDLSVLQASQDKTRNSTTQFEKRLNECKDRVLQSEKHFKKTDLLGDKLASDFFGFHNAFYEHLKSLGSTVNHLRRVFERSVPFNKSTIDFIDGVNDGKLNLKDKAGTLCLCQQNIERFIALQDELKHIVECLDEYVLTNQKKSNSLPQISEPIPETGAMNDDDDELDVFCVDGSIWDFCKLQNISEWCGAGLSDPDIKEATEIADGAVKEIGEHSSHAKAIFRNVTTSMWNWAKEVPDLIKTCSSAECFDLDDDDNCVGCTDLKQD